MKTKICKLCKNKFQDNRNRTKCSGCFTKIRRFRTKKRAIEILGGKCSKCGYKFNNYNIAAFEFHHLYSKDFIIGNVANKSWELILKEIKKCILLCSNCHRIEHSNIYELFLKEVENYQGKLLK